MRRIDFGRESLYNALCHYIMSLRQRTKQGQQRIVKGKGVIMKEYILAHDLGTSGNKATLYDTKGRLCGSSLYEYPTYYPGPGCVEQDPDDWWKAVCVSTKELIDKAGIESSQILAVSFSAQMMGCLLVDRAGEPIRNMIIWADMRAKEQEERMAAALGRQESYRIVGHRLSASYSAAKLLWIRDHEPEHYRRADKKMCIRDRDKADTADCNPLIKSGDFFF